MQQWWNWLELSRPWVVIELAGIALALAFVPTVLVHRRDRPMAALAWILCLWTLPLLGVALWWIFGMTHMKRRRRKHTRALEQLEPSLIARRDQLVAAPRGEGLMIPTQEPGQDEGGDPPALFEEQEGVFPATRGNRVLVHTSGGDAFDAFERAIRQAEEHVHFEFYIWERDETGRRFRDLLCEKARQGVEVRALYDAIGGMRVRGGFLKPLVEAGGQVASFLPVTLLERRLRVNFRNHRKILVTDGHTGFIGGINIADEYLDWMDAAFEFHGPVVYQIQEVFAEDWFFATGEDLAASAYFPPLERVREPDEDADALARVIASGPDQRRRSVQHAFFLGVTLARQRVWLITPYFVPGAEVLMALETAALRGVDVRLILPAAHTVDVPMVYRAGRSFYDRLLEAGVSIFEYQPRILHAKILIVDQRWSFVGSANVDLRSFRLNFETNCLVSDEATNDRLATLFEQSLADCEPIEAARFRERSRRERMCEGAARLFSPMM